MTARLQQHQATCLYRHAYGVNVNKHKHLHLTSFLQSQSSGCRTTMTILKLQIKANQKKTAPGPVSLLVLMSHRETVIRPCGAASPPGLQYQASVLSPPSPPLSPLCHIWLELSPGRWTFGCASCLRVKTPHDLHYTHSGALPTFSH